VFSATAKPALDHLKPGNGDASSALRSGPSPFDRSATPETGVSVIGTDLTLLGEKISIVSQNKLQVDGDVRGNVHGKQVVITKEGSVVGMVCAEKIEVLGGVRGSIRAVTVKLHDTAQVEGDIMHHTLAISEGAQFDGRVRRSSDPQELMPILDPEVIATRPHDGDMPTD
jgi:cytoskeletal protein CcmA (bactofilin family)